MYYEQEDFCAKTKNIVISGKFYEKPNTNPGPGDYDLSRHEKVTKPRSPSPILKTGSNR
jgi:hypothetical protein